MALLGHEGSLISLHVGRLNRRRAPKASLLHGGHTGDLVKHLSDANGDVQSGSENESEIANTDGDVGDNEYGVYARVSRLLVPSALSGAEAAALEALARQGALRLALEDFVQGVESSQVASQDGGSLVLRALCEGVQDTLAWQHAKVAEVEEEARRTSGMTISRVRYLMQDSETVLDRVYVLCCEIEKKDLKGGQVLEIVHEMLARCGVQAVRERLAKILRTCVRVLLNLVEAWTVHGILLDRAHEFFVQERTHKVHVPGQYASGLEDMDEWADSRGHHPLIAEYEWKSRFRIREAMLPTSFFPRDLADLVLFVGKATRVLRRSQLMTSDSQDSASLSLSLLSSTANSSSEEEDKEDGKKTNHGQMALQGYLDALHQARERDQLDMVFVTQAIRSYYKAVARDLQNLVVNHSGLKEHLSFTRDFFLLGQGAFYSFFIELSRSLFASDPRAALPQAEAAVNSGPWREAAEQLGSDAWPNIQERLFKQLRIVLLRPRVDFRAGFGQAHHVPVGTSLADSSSANLRHFHNHRNHQNQSMDSASVVSSRTRRSLYSGSAASSSTTEPHASSSGRGSLSDLVLVGPSSIRGNAIAVEGTSGGLWHGRKLPVERGFQTSVTFRHRVNDEDTLNQNVNHIRPHDNNNIAPDFEVAICVQHDASLGPTALCALDDAVDLDHQAHLNSDQSRTAYGGLRNSVSFVARVAADLSAVRVMVCREGETLFASDPRELVHMEGLQERTHRMNVAYKLQGQDRVKMVAEIDLRDDDDHVLAQVKVPLEIGAEMQLERGSGRAWVGVLLTGPGKVLAWFLSADEAGDKSRAEYDPWRSLLNLHMHVEWPLHLVLTQNALDQYGMLFRFMLCLRRVETALKEAWAALNQTQFKGVVLRGDSAQTARLMTLWRLRSSMAYLVNNLQYHLQVDVVDALHKQLLDQIKTASDFQLVEEAHESFMEALITRSFLHNKVIRNTIDTVLRRCLRFCSLVDRFVRLEGLKAGQASGSAATGSQQQRLDPDKYVELDKAFDDLAVSFSRDATFLYALLTRINSNLLLRVDFNGYFSKLAQGDVKYTKKKHQSNSSSS